MATGFSAGVMLYVFFIEIFPESAEILGARYGDTWGNWFTVLSFFGGMILMAIIDNVIPAADNPHETHSEEETAPLHDQRALLPDFQAAAYQDPEKHLPRVDDHEKSHKRLLRTGLFTALAIIIQNFPEGIATFLAAMQEPSLGVAIALHNIPEGISVSVPIFYATGNRRKAFLYSLISGLAEPLGAVIALGATALISGSGAWNVPALSLLLIQ